MCPNCQDSETVVWNPQCLAYECGVCGTLWNFRDKYLVLGDEEDVQVVMSRGKKLFPIFVYGTLMEGQFYHKFLKDSEKIGNGMVPGVLYWVKVNNFPGAIFDDVQSRVYGELYHVTKEVRDKLDEIEGYREDEPEVSMYARRPVQVSMENGMTAEAEAYEYRGKLWPALLIVGGDFKKATKP